MKYSIITSIGIFILLLSGSCSPTKNAGSRSEAQKATGDTSYAYRTLADYLRRDPKVRISGSGDNLVVYIRSADTITGDFEPLFVIDNSTFATTYAEASRLITVEDIKSVRVLNANEGSSNFGMRGNNGVVLITTKGANDRR